jgi:ankyrin repeat protein
MEKIVYNNKVHNPDTIKIRQDIQMYRDKTCEILNVPTCRIDDTKIRNISYFFTSVITKCPSTNISLNDVRQLQIIGRGSFGYGVSLPNKIVKIIICEQKLIDLIYKEIEYNKIITNSKNEHFMKLLGYFVREDNNGNNVYNYYDNSNNFTTKKCYTTNDNLDQLCEIYLILEKAENGELFNYQYKMSHILSEKINKLLNMYTINEYYLKTYNQFFVHGDIKSDNIVVTKDNNLKLIDYGLATTSSSFFFKSLRILTFYQNLYGKIDFRSTILYLSPFYDVFCILYTFWICYFKLSENIDATKLYKIIVDIQSSNKIILSNKYLYILSYVIHIFFYQLYDCFIDKTLFDNFVDIKMIKYIYNNMFMINDLPQYIDTHNKPLDDYNYFNNIMKHMLNITQIYSRINIIYVNDILLSYIKENINYSDINYSDNELFNLMNNVLQRKIIEFIILKFSNNNFLDENKNNLLYYAVNKDLSLDIIKKIIEKNININNINNDLDTVLSFAIKKIKSSELIILLINNNSDINYIDKNAESIFHLLLKYRYIDIIEIIIDKFLYFNIRDINNNNELQHGIIQKLPQNILEILINKVNINNVNNDGYNSLHLAIQNKNIDIVKKLLEKNIDINTDINNTKSTLYLCLENDILDENILSSILEKTVVNKSISISPINIGLIKNISLNLIDKMIDIYDINQLNTDNSNCLYTLCRNCNDNNFNEYFKLIQKVIGLGININQNDNVFISPLTRSITNKNINNDNKIKLINLFLDNKADLINPSMRASLLIYALQTKLPNDIVYKFINNNIINNVDEHSQNALFYAIMKKYDYYMYKKLIDAGINIKQLSKDKVSPLLLELNINQDTPTNTTIDKLKLLLDKDIINVCNIYEQYPIDIATQFYNINIIGFLLINNSLLTDISMRDIIERFTEKECIELFNLSSDIKNNIREYIDIFKNYNLIDKLQNRELYKKFKHIYKFLLTLRK